MKTKLTKTFDCFQESLKIQVSSSKLISGSFTTSNEKKLQFLAHKIFAKYTEWVCCFLGIISSQVQLRNKTKKY